MVMANNQHLFKAVLLDHYRHPRNHGRLDKADVVKRGRNPRCGDEVEVGVTFDGDKLEKVVFAGRGCSICIASASMMTEAVIGKNRSEADALYRQITDWFSDDADMTRVASSLQALAAVRAYPARKRCVLLAWQALNEALSIN
jgi:nitrogen fixation NifU-like protein